MSNERESGSPSGRLLAVGDIHGCVDELGALIAAIAPRAGDRIVFLGDYVDRGPSSREVIDLLITLRDAGRCEMVFLRGNHEDMFLAYLGEGGRYGDAFLFNGGRATLKSYGLTPPPGDRGPVAIPDAHRRFLRELRFRHLEEPLLFVHAGISPLRSLEQQAEEDLLWIREEFIRNRHRLAQTVVFGHTPQREVFWHLPYKIGLDTGCVYGNKLSCLDFTSEVLLQVARDSRRVTQQNVHAQLSSIPSWKRP